MTADELHDTSGPQHTYGCSCTKADAIECARERPERENALLCPDGKPRCYCRCHVWRTHEHPRRTLQ